MKRFGSATMLLVALAGAFLHAQTIKLRANIPFEFRIGNAVLPAGEYEVHHSADGILRIRDEGGNHSGVMALTMSTSRPGSRDLGGLEFSRYDDTYFLSKVWSPYSNAGRYLPKTSGEKELVSRAKLVETARVSFRNTK
jgi:hypothetical protein